MRCDYRIQNTQFRIQNAKYRIHIGTDCIMPARQDWVADRVAPRLASSLPMNCSSATLWPEIAGWPFLAINCTRWDHTAGNNVHLRIKT